MTSTFGVRSPASVIPLPSPPSPGAVVWDGVTGIYGKVEQNQFDSTTHFPTNYTGTGFTRSVYSELQRYRWMRGIQIDLDWGLIELTKGNYTAGFAKYKAILDKIAQLGDYDAVNGTNKKVLFLITWKTFDISDATRVIPPWLAAHKGAPYSTAAAGPLTVIRVDPVANPVPPHHVNVKIDMDRYDHLWGYKSTTQQAGNDGYGYHFRFADMRNGINPALLDFNGDPIYTFRNAFRDFLSWVYNEVKDHPAFAGFLTIEPSPLTPAIPSLNEYDEAQHFQGRLDQLKWMRQTFTKHMLVEAPNHNTTYQEDMTIGNDGCAANHLGFTGPNMHQGTNIPGLYNARKYLGSVGSTPGVVPLITQCQPQDMKDIKGATPNFWWTWSTTAPNYGGKSASENAPGRPSITGQPLTQNPKQLPAIPATFEWVITRAFEYQRGNILSYQRNLAADNPFNWDDFIAAMNTNSTLYSANFAPNTVLIQDDPDGGAIILQPDFVV